MSYHVDGVSLSLTRPGLMPSFPELSDALSAFGCEPEHHHKIFDQLGRHRRYDCRVSDALRSQATRLESYFGEIGVQVSVGV